MSTVTGLAQGTEHPIPADLLGHCARTERINEFCATIARSHPMPIGHPVERTKTNYVKPE
jgi:hypothetical protein